MGSSSLGSLLALKNISSVESQLFYIHERVMEEREDKRLCSIGRIGSTGGREEREVTRREGKEQLTRRAYTERYFLWGTICEQHRASILDTIDLLLLVKPPSLLYSLHSRSSTFIPHTI